ncbi:unnamed protein product, partial [Ectocarpus sp. 12 AP-2014]
MDSAILSARWAPTVLHGGFDQSLDRPELTPRGFYTFSGEPVLFRLGRKFVYTWFLPLAEADECLRPDPRLENTPACHQHERHDHRREEKDP